MQTGLIVFENVTVTSEPIKSRESIILSMRIFRRKKTKGSDSDVSIKAPSTGLSSSQDASTTSIDSSQQHHLAVAESGESLRQDLTVKGRKQSIRPEVEKATFDYDKEQALNKELDRGNWSELDRSILIVIGQILGAFLIKVSDGLWFKERHLFHMENLAKPYIHTICMRILRRYSRPFC